MTSQSQPVTPVRVPKAATAYTPTTQDPDLRSQINTLLLREGHISKIEQALQHALHAHPSNWSSKVSLHALSLLRSGECTSFPSLMERVLSDIRRDTEESRVNAASNASSAGTGAASAASSTPISSTPKSALSSPETLRKAAVKANGAALGGLKGKAVGAAAGIPNGLGNGAVVSGGGKTGLAVPQTVIEEGLRITRECLEQVCEVDE